MQSCIVFLLNLQTDELYVGDTDDVNGNVDGDDNTILVGRV